MKSSLSIGIVCFPSLGGSGVIASDLAIGLARRGHQVHLLASARPARIGAGCEGLHFHLVEAPEYPVFDHAPYALALASKLVEVSKTHALELVHVHYAVPHAVSAFLAAQVLGDSAPPYIVSLHGTDVSHLGGDPAYQPVVRHAVQKALGVTVPSAFLRDEAYRKLQISPELPIEVMPNFVDTEHFRPANERNRAQLDKLFQRNKQVLDDSPILFHVSNFRAVKRVGDLIRVLAKVNESTPARLVLVGDGPQAELAQRMIRDLGLEQRVCTLGKQDEFAHWLPHADAFLLTSENESFGIAGLEALSAGVPVLGYSVGGVPEVVAPGTGELVPAKDVEALARAVVDFLRSPARADEMRLKARQHAVENFRRGPALERVERWFFQLLDSSGHSLKDGSREFLLQVPARLGKA